MNTQMGPEQWFLLILLSLLWGLSYFLIEIALVGLPPFTLVTIRVAVAALILHLVVLISGRRMTTKRSDWLLFTILGLFGNALPFVLISLGQTHITSSLSAIISATVPLCTLVMAHLLTEDEKITRIKFVGIFIGFAGVLLIIGYDKLFASETSLDSAFVLGQLLVLLATFCYGFGHVYGRQVKKRNISVLISGTGQLTTATVIMLPLSLIIDQPWNLSSPPVNSLLAVLGMAVFSTTIASLVYYRLLAQAGATNLSLAAYLVPVSAILLGTLILDERLQAQHIFGMLMIAAGLAIVDGRIVPTNTSKPNHRRK